jgi:hypothetical protein
VYQILQALIDIVINRFWPSEAHSPPECPCLENAEKPRGDEPHKL